MGQICDSHSPITSTLSLHASVYGCLVIYSPDLLYLLFADENRSCGIGGGITSHYYGVSTRNAQGTQHQANL